MSLLYCDILPEGNMSSGSGVLKVTHLIWAEIARNRANHEMQDTRILKKP
jgi:hypothetical protein